ncbi:MAG: hypothetical protein GX605_06130, partial [Chloroflexi bacterium]|nr:hypothetical protein [Chloroflexota bacterium]
MSSVAATQGGMVWFSKAGVLTFRDGAAWAANTVSQHTFTTGTDLAEAWRETDIWNHVVVRWGGGRVARLTELWAQNETLLLRPGEVRAVRARFSQPAYAVSSPVADVDYKATFYDGSEGTASLGVSATAYAQRATVTLTNGGARPLYVTRLRLRGWPVDFQDEEEAEAEDASSIGRYGRRTLPVRMLYVQSKGQAEAVADFLLARYRSPRATYRLTARAIPWLEVGDRVTVNIAATGHNEDFFIVGLGTAFDVGGGYRHTYELLRCSDLLPYSDWFVVGATAYGAAGRWFY